VGIIRSKSFTLHVTQSCWSVVE